MSGAPEDLHRRLARFGLTLEAAAGDYALVGETFPLRHLIRAAGGRWDGERRRWRLDAAALARLCERLEALAAQDGLAERPATFEQAAGERVRWGQRHYHGHRRRLRERFLRASGAALADYELLELLLFFAVWRRDTKPIAKDMLRRFGSLGGVLAADDSRYRECFGLDPEAVAEGERRQQREDDLLFTRVLLKAIYELHKRVLAEEVRERELISSWSALVRYLEASLAHEPREQFRILFLDRKNRLIADELQGRGTVDHTPLYPREVVRRALELGASAVILVHNHPSGDPTPSEADIAMTRQVVAALQAVGITVHDHVVVGKHGHTSFRSAGLL